MIKCKNCGHKIAWSGTDWTHTDPKIGGGWLQCDNLARYLRTGETRMTTVDGAKEAEPWIKGELWNNFYRKL
jgi:hypothetical protein